MATKTQNQVADRSKNTQTRKEEIKLKSLNDLLIEQLTDLYDAEHQMVKALPQMAQVAESDELEEAFEEHLEETKEHIKRLERAFEKLGMSPKRKPCKAMEGILTEARESIQEKAEPSVHDALLITAAQRAEHYEIAGYGCVRAFAERLGHGEIAELLTETLEEEYSTDKILTEIAESDINEQAADAGKNKIRNRSNSPEVGSNQTSNEEDNFDDEDEDEDDLNESAELKEKPSSAASSKSEMGMRSNSPRGSCGCS